MPEKKDSLVKDMLETTVNVVVGGAAIGVIGNLDVPEGSFPGKTGDALGTGVTSLIGLSIVGDTAKKTKKYL